MGWIATELEGVKIFEPRLKFQRAAISSGNRFGSTICAG